LLEHWIMSAELFDSGGVLERPSPVITFSTEARVTRPPTGAPRGRVDTPTPLPVTRSNLEPQRSLPVIPQIVRRTIVDGDPVLLRAAARAAGVAHAARKSVLGSMAIVGILLAALGASAGVALRSLSDPSQVASSPAAHVSDAIATEAPLVRAAAPARVESAPASKAASDQSTSAGTDRTRTVSSPTAYRARAGEPSHRPAPHGGHASPHQRRAHPTSARPPTRGTPTSKPKAH
jgi:hypothetical protein